MSTTDTSSIAAVSFQNDLSYSIDVYDSFIPDVETAAEDNYFGQLTLLGTIPAESAGNVQPFREITVFIVKNAADGKPLQRFVPDPFDPITSASVSDTDETAMTTTFNFITLVTSSPNDPIVTAFLPILKKGVAKDIDDFFLGHMAYNNCTFETYMMGVAYDAQIPPPAAHTSTSGTGSSGSGTGSSTAGHNAPTTTFYSVAKLVNLMGGTWPSGFPDFAVSDFTCGASGGAFQLSAQLDITDLPAATAEIAGNFAMLFDESSFGVNIHLNYAFGAGIGGTSIALTLDTINIPVGGGNKLSILQPEVSISINPLFKFVVFAISGTIPFNVLGKAFDANISMTIDNVEASIQAVIQGDDSSFPAPPGLSGIHFDAFGVGMGILFEPAGIAIGIQGKFHIGDPSTQTVVQIDDDTFALVCSIVDEVITPVYLSFYVPSMDISQVVEIFTNARPAIDVPVTFSNLSFRWTQDPLGTVTLPDGSLSPAGYSFSASASIFSFSFYGDVGLDLNNGLTANIEMAPVQIGNLFSLTGDGKGVTVKVDANQNPIKNNQIATTKALQQAIASATDMVLVPPGGPVFVINTLSSPILQINAKASFFDILDVFIEAQIAKDGILFQLGAGNLITGNIWCTLSDFHNFSAQFSFVFNRELPLPVVGGFNLGSVDLNVSMDTTVAMTTSLQGVQLTVSGSFMFATTSRNFGPYSISMGTNKLADLIEGIAQCIAGDVENVFQDLYTNAANWAHAEIVGLLTVSSSVTDVMRNGFSQTASGAATLMREVGYETGTVATGLRDSYNLTAQGVAVAMHAAGYASDEVAGALKNVFPLDQIASALSNVYGLSADAVNTTLQKAGYAASDVANAFKSLGGSFASAVSDVFDKVNPF